MIRFPMRRSLHTFAGGVLLASTALAPVAGAKAPPVSDSVAVPMPPTPAGSAPGNLLGQPIAADDGTAQTVHPARRWPRIGGWRSAARRSTAWWTAR
jgi:hypothetical protein